jgi:hypothetical protein
MEGDGLGVDNETNICSFLSSFIVLSALLWVCQDICLHKIDINI